MRKAYIEIPPERLKKAFDAANEKLELNQYDISCYSDIKIDIFEEKVKQPHRISPLWIPYALLNFAPVNWARSKPSPWRSLIPNGGDTIDTWNNDSRQFYNLLVSLTEHFPYGMRLRFALSPRPRPLRILDVGCGSATDAIALHSYFGGQRYGVKGKDVEYLGIDIRDTGYTRKELEGMGRADIRIEEANATHFDRYEFLRGEFDVIVIRHPDVADNMLSSIYRNSISAYWYKMFKESLGHLSDGGVIMITTYRSFEHSAVEGAFRCLDAMQVYAGENDFSSENSFYLTTAWRDNFISLYKKGAKEAKNAGETASQDPCRYWYCSLHR
jgi:SAM-dependent methyltransferase